MKNHHPLIVLLLMVLLINPLSSQEIKSQGGGEYVLMSIDQCLTEEERTEIKTVIQQNKVRLEKEGKLPTSPTTREAIVSFDWPLQQTAGLNYNSYFSVSNFVDQDPSSMLLDYNCNARTYDGHKGIDIVTWPFGWYIYDNDFVEVIAAEAGTIINKFDGYDDDHCSCIGTWNAVYIVHSDGSTAWYGHMKKNSLLAKSVGDTVEKGEYLGVVASSGCSTAPHLHLEIYDANGNLIDPYQGSCNSLNTESWWANQPDNREPKLNVILTHDDVPVHGCPGTDEEPYLSNSFMPGEIVYTAAYYQDQLVNSQSALRIRRPDNSIWNSWTHVSPNTYSGSWWYWSWTLPAAGPYGIWTFEVSYMGETLTHEFTYGTLTAISTAHSITDIDLFPNPTTGKFNVIGIKTANTIATVIDCYGRTLKTQSPLVEGLDLSEFPTGLYYVTFTVEGENSITKKIVKL